jgi:hypothetical protein
MDDTPMLTIPVRRLSPLDRMRVDRATLFTQNQTTVLTTARWQPCDFIDTGGWRHQ